MALAASHLPKLASSFFRFRPILLITNKQSIYIPEKAKSKFIKINASTTSRSTSNRSIGNMGNCVFGGYGHVQEMIKVVTSGGGVMELYAPITAECITNEFPGHAIYRSRDLLSAPLLHNDPLLAGDLYYLLPINAHHDSAAAESSSSPPVAMTPYRMSLDSQRVPKRQPAAETEVFPRYRSRSGVWKVRLVISPEQLADILQQEARTEELIDSVRTVAKCGNHGAAESVASSDNWSVVSSWKLGSFGKYNDEH